MNIYQIADKAGVSVATVSRVINGSDKVRPDTRRKIEQIMEECHFTKFNAHARRKKTRILALVTVSITAGSSASFLEELLHLIADKGYHTLLSCCLPDFLNLHANLDAVREYADAYIIMADRFNEWPQSERSYLINLAKTIPVILINGHIDSPGIYNVLLDSPQKVFDIVDSQLKNNISDIMYLFSSMSAGNMHLLNSYREALTMNHLEANPALIHLCPTSVALENYLTEYLTDNSLPHLILTGDTLLSQNLQEYLDSYMKEHTEDVRPEIRMIHSLNPELAHAVCDITFSRLNAGYAASTTIIRQF